MGTRSAAKIKLRTPPYRCDVCGRRLMNAEALRTHQICHHNIISKVKTKAPLTKQGVTKTKSQQQTQKKNIKSGNIGVKPKSVPSKKMGVNTKPSNKIIEKGTGKRAAAAAKPVETCNEYECPKCSKIFPIYFLALRHIQINHCVNNNNDKVSPNSPDLIKPNAVLICVKCNKRPKSLETHKCTTYKFEAGNSIPSPPFYTCMACNQQFQSLRLFDLHVSGLHCDGVESMFFPTNEVFQTWKEDVINQTGIKYYMLGNYNYKQMLRCPCVPESESTIDDISPFLCPSCIVVQELSKGIQVHIYRNHYGHKCGAYTLPEIYKKYTLSTLIQNEEAYTEIDGNLIINETDIYQEFKELMECIVQDAAKVNIDSLKILISKALDMTSVLNNEDDKECASVKKVLEKNITGILGKLGNQGTKKRTTSEKSKVEPITKRFKTRTYQNKDGSKEDSLQDASIKIVNSFSLAEQDISDAINESSENEDTENKTGRQTPDNDTDESSSDKEKDETENIKVKKKDEHSPTSFAESYKDFVKQFNISPQAKKDSRIKPNWSNKKSTNLTSKPQNVAKETKPLKPTKTETLPSEDNLKVSDIPRAVDLKYEVKEQENDCNILILKI